VILHHDDKNGFDGREGLASSRRKGKYHQTEEATHHTIHFSTIENIALAVKQDVPFGFSVMLFSAEALLVLWVKSV